MKKNPLILAHISLFIVALIYGANYTIAKIVLDDNYIPPLGFILLRVSAGAILFTFFHTIFIKEKIERSDWGRLFLCACFGVAINMMFFFKGLQLTGAINASLIMTTTPILVLITSAILIKERIVPRKILGIIIGCTGAILLILKGKELTQNDPIGDVMVLVNAVSYGIYLVLVKSLIQKYHPITIVKWVFLIGFFLVLPFGGADLLAVKWASLSASIWWAVAYVLIGTTFFTYLLNATALRIVNPSTASIYIYLQPLIASIIAVGVGKGSWTMMTVVAAVLIFFGVGLVSKR